MAVTLQGSTLNNIRIGNSGAGGGGAISAVAYANDAGTWSTSSNTYTTAGRSIAITANTGSSVLVTISAVILGAQAGGTGFASVAVSGATTRAASDATSAQAASVSAGYPVGASATFMLSGLTPGSNTFTLQFRSDYLTQQFRGAHLVVQTLA